MVTLFSLQWEAMEGSSTSVLPPLTRRVKSFERCLGLKSVIELKHSAVAHVVILGKLGLAFNDGLPPLMAGMRRSFVLRMSEFTDSGGSLNNKFIDINFLDDEIPTAKIATLTFQIHKANDPGSDGKYENFYISDPFYLQDGRATSDLHGWALSRTYKGPFEAIST